MSADIRETAVHALTDHVLAQVRGTLVKLYAERAADLPYHGWPHVEFVAAKTVAFADELGADVRTAELAALVHDLNYLVDPTTYASAGAELRTRILAAAGIDQQRIEQVEQIVNDAEIRSRGNDLSAEAKALSDADTLFKALPITPIVLAPRYLRETGRTLRELAENIVQEQIPLEDAGIYFYAESARRRYASWSSANLRLWRCVLDSLEDPDVVGLLERISGP
jgi:uncharacterized protein